MTVRTVLMGKWQESVVRTILDQGCALYLVLDDADLSITNPDPALLSRCAHVYRVSSFDSHEQLAAVAADLISHGIEPDLLFGHTEFCQLGMGYLEILLGTAKHPRAHAALRDKRLMKAAVTAAGVPVARWRSLPDPSDMAAAREVRDSLTFPVVVKPACGVGAMSTHKVGCPEDFDELLNGYAFEPLLRSRHLIVEEFVPGREFHVDAFWQRREPKLFLISSYHQARLELTQGASSFQQVDGSYVLPKSDAPELYRRIGYLHHRVNEALNITDTVTHLEFFETPDGQHIFSEVAARFGGSYVPYVLTAHIGENAWSSITGALLTGLAPSWPEPDRYVGGINLRPSAPGQIRKMPDEAAIRSLAGVCDYVPLRRVGDTMSLRHRSEWAAFVILTGNTEKDYLALAEKIVADHPVMTA